MRELTGKELQDTLIKLRSMKSEEYKYYFEDEELDNDRLFTTSSGNMIFNLTPDNNIGWINWSGEFSTQDIVEGCHWFKEIVAKKHNVLLNCNLKNGKMVKVIKALCKYSGTNYRILKLNGYLGALLNINKEEIWEAKEKIF